LKCQTKDGKACTAAHLADLNKSAVALKAVPEPAKAVGAPVESKKPDSPAKN
jgi:hypothetical protein